MRKPPRAHPDRFARVSLSSVSRDHGVVGDQFLNLKLVRFSAFSDAIMSVPARSRTGLLCHANNDSALEGSSRLSRDIGLNGLTV